MRRDNWIEATIKWIFEGILTILWLFWKLVRTIFALLGKLATDVAKNVYGKIVMVLGAIAFGYIILLFSGLLK